MWFLKRVRGVTFGLVPPFVAHSCASAEGMFVTSLGNHELTNSTTNLVMPKNKIFLLERITVWHFGYEIFISKLKVQRILQLSHFIQLGKT
jgi:hypothetical protein